jgi:hypothetical protein
MQFLSCFSVPCQSIVAVIPGQRVSACPTCGRPLLQVEGSGGLPIGFTQETKRLVLSYGAAYWRVDVRCVER